MDHLIIEYLSRGAFLRAFSCKFLKNCSTYTSSTPAHFLKIYTKNHRKTEPSRYFQVFIA
ncbi:MAG: hypothetical protein A3F13_02870 [Gammaproteobacteria bacterium RIFCSPHIGHO2_12_FULL_40_19]|nr:MAG: hypothetical protein A3F13_02870 [Gammaproteobacteria bacterium RIFCSPHIGHO2_12_FULL_40_19]